MILSSKYLQGKHMEAEIPPVTSRAQTSGVVRHGGESVSPVKGIFWVLLWAVKAR